MTIPCLEKPMKKCNCDGERCGKCSPGYQCCQQIDSKFGLCIDKTCECDTRLGLPPKSSRDNALLNSVSNSVSSAVNAISEKISVNSDEGYTENYTMTCDDWRNTTIAFAGIFFVLLIITLIFRFKNA